MDTTAERQESANDADRETLPGRGAPCVLEVENPRTAPDRGVGLVGDSLALARGSFELADAGDAEQAALFCDLCSGLIDPAAGVVRFLGHDWKGLPHEYANALRGRIGRDFAEEGWTPHLSLVENILLQQQHHTRRTEHEILAEASALAGKFGLPGIPVSRPEDVAPFDLARAALVRAFVGEPDLVLLEHPLRGRYMELLEPLVNVIARACRRGATVLWLTLTPGVWALPNLPVDGRFRLSGGRLTRITP